MVFLTALSKVLPVFLLILMGVCLRRWRFIGPETVKDLRKLVVNITLPARLLRRIDDYARAHHETRSGFLARAAMGAMHPD